VSFAVKRGIFPRTPTRLRRVFIQNSRQLGQINHIPAKNSPHLFIKSYGSLLKTVLDKIFIFRKYGKKIYGVRANGV
jgi:hypothetical protein